jgi:hypothetical protein
MTVDTGALRRAMRRWADSQNRLRRLDAALNALYGGRRRPAGRVHTAELAERLLLLVARDYEGGMVGRVGQMEASLARLLDDAQALRSGATIAGRTAELRRADLETLRRGMEQVQTLDRHARQLLARGTPASQVEQLRREMLAAMGPPPGRAAAGAARAAGAPSLEDATARLRRALRQAPAPQQIPGRRPLTARQLGAQTPEVAEAALAVLAASGDDTKRAVQHLLTSGPVAGRNELVTAVLQAAAWLEPGRRAPNVPWGRFQVEVTGSPFEWTGHLRHPVRGFDTIGIDGLVDGWVVDAKLTSALAAESGHLHGRVGLPRGEEELQGGVRSYRRWVEEPDEPLELVELFKRELGESITLREELARAEKFEIATLGEMERQLQFAKENGLKGVRWVASSEEVAEVFEREFAERFRAFGVTIDVQVGP